MTKQDDTWLDHSAMTVQKQLQKDSDGIKIQLKELYDEKELRQKKALEREMRGRNGERSGCSSNDIGREDRDAQNSEDERFH